jgi:hypothetical protein
VGENQTTQASMASRAANQDARKPTILIAAFFYPFALVIFRATLAKSASEDRATPSPTPHHPGAQQEAHKLTIVVTAFLVLLDAFALFRALAHQVGENHTTQASTASRAADQDARKPTILIAAFLFLDAFALFRTFAHQVGENHTTQASPASRAANQDARKPTILIAAFFYPFALVIFRTMLAKSASEDRATPSPTPHHPGAQQEAHKLTIVVTAFLFRLYALALIVFRTFRALAHQVNENHTTQASTASRAANEDARKPTILIAAFLFFLDIFGALAAILALVAQETGDEQTTQALAALRFSAGELPNECLLVSVRAVMGRCTSHWELLTRLWLVGRWCASAQQRYPAPRRTADGL